MPASHPMQKVFEKYSDLTFEYGTADCCTFVGECVEAMGYRNPMRRVQYDNGFGAAILLSRAGSLAFAISERVGNNENPEWPEDGDIALIPDNNGHHAAAVVFNGRLVAKTKTGIMDYPLSKALRFWRCRR